MSTRTAQPSQMASSQRLPRRWLQPSRAGRAGFESSWRSRAPGSLHSNLLGDFRTSRPFDARYGSSAVGPFNVHNEIDHPPDCFLYCYQW